MRHFLLYRQVIERGADKSLSIERIDYETVAEFLIIILNVGQQQAGKVNLAKGSNYTVSMNFVANLTETSAGFFRSVYMEDGVER